MALEPNLAAEFANHLSQLDLAFSGHDVGNVRNELERMMARADVTSEIIARATTIGLSGVAPVWVAGKIAVANTYLQRKLTQEHVAAQEKMGEAADRMAAASLRVAEEAHKTSKLSFVLTLASVIIGLGAMISAVLIAQTH